MAYVDVAGRRFDHLVPWREWAPPSDPALVGFFVVSTPRDEWGLSSVTVRREAFIHTSDEIEVRRRRPGLFESWMEGWDAGAVYPGEVFAIGTYLLPTDDRAKQDDVKLAIYRAGHFAPFAEQNDEWWVKQLTQDLRSGNPQWQRIATVLAGHGVAPQTALVAAVWPEDVRLEHYIVVTPAGRVFEFDYDFGHTTSSEGTVADWQEVSDRWGNNYGAEYVEIALRLIEAQ